MIKELRTYKKQNIVRKLDRSKDITDIIREELAEYLEQEEKEQKEKTISDLLFESHNFFNELDNALGIIISDLKKPQKNLG
jgi:glutamyl-tRNA reductase